MLDLHNLDSLIIALVCARITWLGPMGLSFLAVAHTLQQVLVFLPRVLPRYFCRQHKNSLFPHHALSTGIANQVIHTVTEE